MINKKEYGHDNVLGEVCLRNDSLSSASQPAIYNDVNPCYNHLIQRMSAPLTAVLLEQCFNDRADGELWQSKSDGKLFT